MKEQKGRVYNILSVQCRVKHSQTLRSWCIWYVCVVSDMHVSDMGKKGDVCSFLQLQLHRKHKDIISFPRKCIFSS